MSPPSAVSQADRRVRDKVEDSTSLPVPDSRDISTIKLCEKQIFVSASRLAAAEMALVDSNTDTTPARDGNTEAPLVALARQPHLQLPGRPGAYNSRPGGVAERRGTFLDSQLDLDGPSAFQSREMSIGDVEKSFLFDSPSGMVEAQPVSEANFQVFAASELNLTEVPKRDRKHPEQKKRKIMLFLLALV